MPGDDRPVRGPIAWMARNRVAANLLMLFVMAGGAMATWSITKEYLPDTTEESVSVILRYPGASPEEMEQGVLLAIEEAVKGLPNADEIWSISFPGWSIFRVRLAAGGNLQQLSQDVQSALDSIRSFPEEMEKPWVTIDPRRRDVLSLVIYGDADRLVLKDAAELVRDTLRRTGKITQIELRGLPRLQVNVDIAEAELRHLGLTRGEVAALIRTASVDLAAGGVKASTGAELVRVQDRRHYAREFARIPLVATADGGVLRLGDVARVTDGFEDTDQQATYNGQPAVMLQLFRIGEETPAEVARAVDDSLKVLRGELSDRLHVEILDSRAEAFNERVALLLKNGAMGLALVLLVLGTLLNSRLAFWVMMGIPISFLGAMFVVPPLGVSINMMTLFAFILALGIVVDDAIVVGENVYAHRERGKPWLVAAVDGTREVARPVVFSVLTNIVAVTPLLFMPGERGRLFWMVPVLVIAAFTISLVECLFVLPAHLGHARREGMLTIPGVERLRRHVVVLMQRFIDGVYGPFLERALRRARLVPFAGLAVLLVGAGYMLSGRMGYQSFPTVESDFAQGAVVFPYGTPVKQTMEMARRMADAARQIGGRAENRGLIKGIFADIGHEGSHTAEVLVYLAKPEIREEIMSTVDFVRVWRKRVGEAPGIDSLRFSASAGGPVRGHTLSLELSHRDPEMLAGAAEMLTAKLDEYPIVTEVNHDFQTGQPQNDVRLNEVGRAMGLDAQSLARQLRGKFYGIESKRQLRERDEVIILVRGTERERTNMHEFENTLVKTPAGTFVPLHRVATVERGRAYTKIERRHGARVADVDADITPPSMTAHIISQVEQVIMPEVLERYPGLVKRFSGRQEEDRRSMGSLLWTFPLALVAIFALLAVPFGSYSLGLLIVGMTVPFGFIGAMLGHIVMGYSLTIPGLLGFIALSGVLVNDSLILVDFAERQRRRGSSAGAAARTAAMQRFRPIVLTTITTFAGLAPMIFETSRQARFLIPMAISLGFGLLFATAMILLMLPPMYLLLDRLGRLPPVA